MRGDAGRSTAGVLYSGALGAGGVASLVKGSTYVDTGLAMLTAAGAGWEMTTGVVVGFARRGHGHLVRSFFIPSSFLFFL